MSVVKHVGQESSNNITFKCCKTKTFIHFVCTKCFSIYHKSCLPKYKKKIRFLKDNKLICCDDEEDNLNINEDKSILEKTIDELTQESNNKNKYIYKIKMDHDAFLQEALQREEEMSELIKIQEKTIEDLRHHISEMRKTIHETTMSKPKMDSKCCQTSLMIKKDFSVNTELNPYTILETESVKTQLKNANKKQQKPAKSKPLVVPVENQNQGGNNVGNNILQGDSKNNSEANTVRPKIDINSGDVKSIKKRVLLLVEDDIIWHVRKILNLQYYEVSSIKKPGALLGQIINNMETLTKDFTLQDYVFIIGGKNDIKLKRTPSFKMICDKLKMCTHTNIIFSSIPYNDKKYVTQNKHIFKFNTKLNDFLSKFNSYSEGYVGYMEINDDKMKGINNQQVAASITKMILMELPCKNLIFINCSHGNIISGYTNRVSNSVLNAERHIELNTIDLSTSDDKNRPKDNKTKEEGTGKNDDSKTEIINLNSLGGANNFLEIRLTEKISK